MRKGAVWTAVVIAALAIYGAATGQSEVDAGSGSGSAPTSSTGDARSPDANLTIIELGHRDDGSRTHRRIATLLDLTQADCPNDSREQLADMTANTITLLDEAGVKAAPVEILEDIRESSSLRISPSCVNYFAMYAALRRDVG